MRDDAAMLQRDRYAILRKAVNEVGGAVERIDDPDVFIVVVQVGGSTRFLGQDCVVGIGLVQHLDDRLFGGMVDFGDEIVVLFFSDLEAVEVERGAVDDRGAAAGGLDRRVEHRVHRASVKMTVPRAHRISVSTRYRTTMN